MTESKVQVSPAGGGPNVRALTITERQSDGTDVDVLMQVVSIADADGQTIDLSAMSDVRELMRINNALLRAVVFQLSFLNAPRSRIEDLSVFMSDESML